MSAPADALSRNAGEFGVIAVRGPDSAKFLQGQLSADMDKLAPGARTLAGLHNPQGRVIAVLDIARTSAEEFLATLPGELVVTVAQRLRRFVLRAKVRIEETSQVSADLSWQPGLAAVGGRGGRGGERSPHPKGGPRRRKRQ
jgi:folate-binding Fe-S cluster repair protein YgfZ